MKKTIYDNQYKQIIEKLVITRKNLGFTQDFVAERLGTHQSFISKIENCERRLDVLEFVKLVDLYNIDIGIFFTDEH